MEAIAKHPAPEKLMILSWFAGSFGPCKPTQKGDFNGAEVLQLPPDDKSYR